MEYGVEVERFENVTVDVEVEMDTAFDAASLPLVVYSCITKVVLAEPFIRSTMLPVVV